MDEMMNQIPAEPVEPEQAEEKKEATKPFSLRLGEDSMQAFRTWCEENNFNQADGFSNLIKMLELQKTKDLIPNRQKEVENFQSLLTSMTDAFLHSLELNENAEMRIRQTLQTQLESKEQSILDYQESAKKQNEKVKELKEKADQVDVLQKEIEELKKNIEQRDNQLKDKDELNLILTEKLAKAESMEDEVNALKQALEDKDDEIIDLEKQIEVEKASCETAKIKAAQEAKDKLVDEIETKYQSKLKEELTLWNERTDKLQEKVENLAGEKSSLQVRLDRLQQDFNTLKEECDKKAQTIERITDNYNALRDEYRDYKKMYSKKEEVQQQEDPDQLTLDDIKE